MLVGVIHLPPLPGSPGSKLSARECAASAARCAGALAGYDAIIVENFGDAPFFAGKVQPVTVAAMTACALAVREAAPQTKLGINVLRNDGEAALSIAACVDASFIRVNVLTGARVTDQGIIQGDAANLARLRRSLNEGIAIWADVDVKHSSPLGALRPLVQEVEDTAKRALASAVLVTGDGTGKGVDLEKLASVKKAAGKVPVLVASGATLATLDALAPHADGVIVGSALRIDGVPGGSVDATLAKTFADAYRRVFQKTP